MPKIFITLEELDLAIKDQVENFDFDELARIAGDWFGGSCEFYGETNGEDIFIFTPDPEEYQGAFDHINKEKQ